MELLLASLCGFLVPVYATKSLLDVRFFFTNCRALMTFG